MISKLRNPESRSHRWQSVLFVGLLLMLSSGAVLACMWDTDTLANEAKGLPDVVQVATGRFERNPPLYYELRLKRVTEDLAKSPGLFSHYDDAAVACDHLNRDDEAFAWLEKKRIQLQKLDQTSSEVKEHWYRYYAVLGTVRAHRWMRNGADRKHIAEMKQARDEIAKAIALNPNAHFGREKIQLAFMSWMINPIVKKEDKDVKVTFRGYIDQNEEMEAEMPPNFRTDIPGGGATKEEWVQGLVGLIVQGDAWESVDTLDTLSHLLISDKATVAYLARLRREELKEQGHNSVFPDLFSDREQEQFRATLTRLPSDRMAAIKQQFLRLREEAEEWQKRRTDYMMVRLNAGRHPDTDPTFWEEWHDSGPPSLELSWNKTLGDPNFISHHWPWYVLAYLALFIGIVVTMVRIWRYWRRYHLQRVSEIMQRKAGK